MAEHGTIGGERERESVRSDCVRVRASFSPSARLEQTVIVPFHSEERRVLIDAIRRWARLVQVGSNRDIMPGGGTTAAGTGHDERCIATRVAAIHRQSENILCMKVGGEEGASQKSRSSLFMQKQQP
jgi:hypothetical protein